MPVETGGAGTWPILAFELTWSGTTHAPGNGSTLETIALAFPECPIQVYAEPGHLAELARSPTLTRAGVAFHAVAISRQYPGQPGIVSWRRLAREIMILARALRQVPRGQTCLVVLLSATSTAIFAASWLARLRRAPTAVQVGLHGNLHDAGGWRSRDPLRRAFDMTSAMAADHGGRLRFLVLDDAIRTALAARNPTAAACTDVLPLPINISEVAEVTPTVPRSPLRFGFVGQATEAKGIDIYLRLASDLRARYPGRVAFHLVGRAMPGTDPAIFAPLAEPPPDSQLSRAAFLQALLRLHYVVLPFRQGYYDLAASGALIDALTWLKPVLALPVGFVTSLFAEAGDIGELCEDEADLQSRLENLLIAPDEQRYARQVAALRQARSRRLPAALAPMFRAMMLRRFPCLVGQR